jgi:parallel beta-helix repeat protein
MSPQTMPGGGLRHLRRADQRAPDGELVWLVDTPNLELYGRPTIQVIFGRTPCHGRLVRAHRQRDSRSASRAISVALLLMAAVLLFTATAAGRARTGIIYPQVLNVSDVCRDGIRFEYANTPSVGEEHPHPLPAQTNAQVNKFAANSPPVPFGSNPPAATIVAKKSLKVPYKQVDIIAAAFFPPKPIQHREYSGIFTVKWTHLVNGKRVRQPLSPGTTVQFSIPPFIVNFERVVKDCQLPAPNPRCGRVVKKDTTLHADLLGCVGDGLVVGGDGITIDLNGHRIAGTGIGAGINNGAGHDDLRVKDGSIRGFTTGVHVVQASDIRLRKLALSGNGDAGILLAGSYGRVVKINDSDGIFIVGSHNRVTQNTAGSHIDYGIFVKGSHNDINRNAATGPEAGVAVTGSSNQIEMNTVAGNSQSLQQGGIVLFGDGLGGQLDVSHSNRIADNTVSHGALDGIAVFASGTLLFGNTTTANGDDGIEVAFPPSQWPPWPPIIGTNSSRDNADLGIEAEAGVTDGGGNVATGNRRINHPGLVAECTGVTCS